MNIRNSESLTRFIYKILKFIRSSKNRAFPCNNPKGIQLLNQVRLSFSHLREHESKYNFQYTFNSTCSCGEDIVILLHYLLHCSICTNERLALLNVIQSIANSILELYDSHIVEVLLHGRNFLDLSSKTYILNTTINFLLETKRFDKTLFQSKNQWSHGFLHFHFSCLISSFTH